MSLPIFCTPEESVDFEISIGLIPENERQTAIDKIYERASEILSDLLGTDYSTV